MKIAIAYINSALPPQDNFISWYMLLLDTDIVTLYSQKFKL
jgi:hypothetical protein